MSKTTTTNNFKDLIHKISLLDPDITEITLDAAQLIGNDDLQLRDALKENIFLRKLSLTNCNLNDATITNIFGENIASSLIALNLNGNDISFLGTAVLAKISHLEVLDLSSNRLGDKGVLSFSANSTEQHFASLNFAKNGIDDLAEKFLMKIVEGNKSLKEFRLDGNEISPAILGRISSILEKNIADSEDISQPREATKTRESTPLARQMDGASLDG